LHLVRRIALEPDAFVLSINTSDPIAVAALCERRKPLRVKTAVTDQGCPN
jgi:hypothetical protein